MIADMHAGVLEVRDNATPHDPLTQALTPWLEPGAKPLIDRASVRTRLGVAEEELLVTLVGDPPAAIDALPALYALGILHVAGVRATLVLPRGCGQFDRALRHVHQGGYLHGLRVTDEPLSLIAVGCDLGICAPLSWSENEPLCEPSFSTKLAVARARKIQRFLSQPFHVAEVFTGSPGKYVPLKETIRGFKMLVDGECDHLPEQAFYMVGSIDEAFEKAKKLQ